MTTIRDCFSAIESGARHVVTIAHFPSFTVKFCCKRRKVGGSDNRPCPCGDFIGLGACQFVSHVATPFLAPIPPFASKRHKMLCEKAENSQTASKSSQICEVILENYLDFVRVTRFLCHNGTVNLDTMPHLFRMDAAEKLDATYQT